MQYQIPAGIWEDVSTLLETIPNPEIINLTAEPQCPLCHYSIIDSRGRSNASHISMSSFDKEVRIERRSYIKRLVFCTRTARSGYGAKPFPYFFFFIYGEHYFLQTLQEDIVEAILILEHEYFSTEYFFKLSEINILRVLRQGDYGPSLTCPFCMLILRQEALVTDEYHTVSQKETISDLTVSILEMYQELLIDSDNLTRYTILCNRTGHRWLAYSMGSFWKISSVLSDMKPKVHSEIKGEIPCPECNENFFLKGLAEHKVEKSWLLGTVPNKKILCSKTNKSFLYILPSGKEASVLSLTINRLARAGTGKAKIFWEIDPSETTSEEFLTDYFDKSLMVGVELELDAKEGFDFDSLEFRNMVERKFNTQIMGYHSFPRCKSVNCRDSGCWRHLPENLIRAISQDASIKGYEFVIYGSNIRSEEFSKRLPLESMKELFRTTTRDGLHLHLLLVDHQVLEIPSVVARNVWQIFRFYYPGWVYLFGNTKPTFLRNSKYVPFAAFKQSALKKSFFEDLRGIQINSGGHHQDCGGLYYSQLQIYNNKIINFDIEIRTNDATVDLEQIVAARALGKALVLRSAQLSNFGIIKCTTDPKLWDKVSDTIESLNRFEVVEGSDEEKFMKYSALRMLRELAPFLSEFERKCVQSIIDGPVRERSPNQLAKLESVFRKDSKLIVQLKKVIALGEETAENFDEWVKLTAKSIDQSEAEIKLALEEMHAIYDPYCKMVIVKSV